MYWPNDVDGDVFRTLEEHGFDFSKEHEIEINIDFDSWPLSDSIIHAISELFPDCNFIEPDEDDIENDDTNGYVQFYITEKLSYDLIVKIQKEVTDKVKAYGGWCDSWGVMSH